MKLFITIARLIVGSLFIVSGLIKCNDSIGFSYKLNDYFVADVLNLEFLMPYALGLAVIICVVEIVLGIALIFGFKSKLTTTLILLMMLFFTWLTWYTSSCIADRELAVSLGEEFNRNCVEDCGCFGDALKLKPIESFYKDLFLLVFTIPLFIASFLNTIKVNTKKEDWYYMAVSIILIIGFGVGIINWWFTVLFSVLIYAVVYAIKNNTKNQWLPLLASYVVALGFTWYCLQHLPLKDFRAYKVGNNIANEMATPPNAAKPVMEYTWVFNVNGQEKEFITNGSYPEVNGEYVKVSTKIIDEGFIPAIQDFSIESIDNDYTEQYLKLDKLVIIAMYNIDKTETQGNKKLKAFANYAQSKGYKVIGLTASSTNLIKPFKTKFNLDFEFYFGDEKAIKTIIRSNPGVLVLNKGNIINKAHWNDIEAIDL